MEQCCLRCSCWALEQSHPGCPVPALLSRASSKCRMATLLPHGTGASAFPRQCCFMCSAFWKGCREAFFRGHPLMAVRWVTDHFGMKSLLREWPFCVFLEES